MELHQLTNSSEYLKLQQYVICMTWSANMSMGNIVAYDVTSLTYPPVLTVVSLCRPFWNKQKQSSVRTTRVWIYQRSQLQSAWTVSEHSSICSVVLVMKSALGASLFPSTNRMENIPFSSKFRSSWLLAAKVNQIVVLWGCYFRWLTALINCNLQH